MRTSIIWLLMALVMLASANAVIEDTNVTLRAGCVDNYGNLCTSQGRWTIIQPDGTTLYNETAGENDDYGITNFTIWLNTTGVWYAYVNFTDQNVSREYNIVVEDYINTTDTTVSGDVKMMGVFLLIAAIIIVLGFLAMKMDQEHAIIRWFLVFMVFLFIILGIGLANIYNTNTNLDLILSTALYVSITMATVVFLYAIIYTVYISTKKLGDILPDDKKRRDEQI